MQGRYNSAPELISQQANTHTLMLHSLIQPIFPLDLSAHTQPQPSPNHHAAGLKSNPHHETPIGIDFLGRGVCWRTISPPPPHECRQFSSQIVERSDGHGQQRRREAAGRRRTCTMCLFPFLSGYFGLVCMYAPTHPPINQFLFCICSYSDTYHLHSKVIGVFLCVREPRP